MKRTSIRYLLSLLVALSVALLLVTPASAGLTTHRAHQTRTAKSHVKAKAKGGSKKVGTRPAKQPKRAHHTTHAKTDEKGAPAQAPGEEAGESEGEEGEGGEAAPEPQEGS